MLVLFMLGMFPTVAIAQESLEDGAITDLSERINVPIDQIVVQSVTQVTWPDALLGCYVPGYSGAQVLTGGWRLVLIADGAEHYYHANRSEPAFWCSPEHTSLGYPILASLATVPLSVGLQDVSILPQSANVQFVFLMMILGTIYAVYRVHCEYERK